MNKDSDISIKFLLIVGANIKKKRREKQLTLEQLGLEIGLTRMQVHRIESGYNITLTTLIKIAIVLGLKPENLVKTEFKFKKEDLERLVNQSKSNQKNK